MFTNQPPKLSSRIRFLKQTLKTLGFTDTLRATDLMIEEMCAEKNFVRQGDGSHYYYHLASVTQKLANFGCHDQATLTAAMLHDAIEDVPWITEEYLRREYGEDVSKTVALVTKDPNIDYKRNPEELDKYLYIIAQTLRSALVKASDRVHNFGTLAGTSPEKQLRQALETERHFFPFFKYCRETYPEYSDFFFEAKTQIEPHLEKIKASALADAVAKAQQKATRELIQSGLFPPTVEAYDTLMTSIKESTTLYVELQYQRYLNGEIASAVNLI